ncbi:squalene/phytoene synthase family protein [Octadecabacter sp. G9-8]|uniref:Squalene/phytoene synthase family protein n=1 Tax=Octadecabacter dasysiphoniae TaxID=2909341 RepID=A0ABS9D2K4_9RHOB|nr:squalene/phytoene synthase family protein [Octadecabacter dasysiphoniae]MCF2872849.1 squalene/phytoene synthase family protein [Octadecabacter dasysiphoniae]
MSFEACARIVQQGDPDRFLAVMSCPVEMRRILFPIYAFNVEVARAPWVTEEPMIAEMRLQWWRDALDEISAGGTVRKHEVTTALSEVLDPEGARLLGGLVAARRWDIYKDAFEDLTHFEEYMNATSGDLLWTATRLGAVGRTRPDDQYGNDGLERNVKRYGVGIGVANWFRAIPELEARGRIPLLGGTPEAVRLQALGALRDLNAARSDMGRIDAPVASVLRVGWRAQRTLQTAARDPMSVANGRLDESPIVRRFSLFWRTVRDRY